MGRRQPVSEGEGIVWAGEEVGVDGFLQPDSVVAVTMIAPATHSAVQGLGIATVRKAIIVRHTHEVGLRRSAKVRVVHGVGGEHARGQERV